MSYVRNYAVERGTDWDCTFTVDEAITGWALEFLLSTTPEGPATVSVTTGSGVTITDGPGGVCVVVLTSAQLSLAPGLYYHRLRRTDPGSRCVLAKGEFTIDPYSAA